MQVRPNLPLVLLALLAPALSALAEEPAPAGWSLDLASYGWLAATTGTVGVATVRANVDNSFLDTLNQTDSILPFMARGELRNGRLGLFVDGIYMRLGFEDVRVIGRVTANVTSELSIVEFGAALQLAEGRLGGEGGWALDALGAGRWTRLRNEVGFSGGRGTSASVDWVDPVVGLRLRGRLSPRWDVALRGDIGGFGAGTNFAWQAAATFGYRFDLFGREATAAIGYRALSQDYESARLNWNMTLHGPVLGLSLRF